MAKKVREHGQSITIKIKDTDIKGRLVSKSIALIEEETPLLIFFTEGVITYQCDIEATLDRYERLRGETIPTLRILYGRNKIAIKPSELKRKEGETFRDIHIWAELPWQHSENTYSWERTDPKPDKAYAVIGASRQISDPVSLTYIVR